MKTDATSRAEEIAASLKASVAIVRASDPAALPGPMGQAVQETPMEKMSAVAGYGGSGAAVLSSAAMEVHKYLGLTPAEWQVVGIVGGLFFGFLGFAWNAWLGWRRDQREVRARGLT